jgi:hypothetical protein
LLGNGRLLARAFGAAAALSILLVVIRLAPLIRPPILDVDLLAGRARFTRPQILSPARILDPASDVQVAADTLSEWARGEVLDLWKPESWNGSRARVSATRMPPVSSPTSAPGKRKLKQDTDESAKAVPNGTELILAYLRSGVGVLPFVNHTDLEEIAVLSQRKSPVRAIYIRPQSDAFLKRIDNGVYELHLEFGFGADLKRLRFERARFTPELLGPVEFFSVTTPSGTSGQHYEVVVDPPGTKNGAGLPKGSSSPLPAEGPEPASPAGAERP